MRLPWWLAVLCAAVASSPSPAGTGPSAPPSGEPGPSIPSARPTSPAVPVARSFERNLGQTDGAVEFLARARGFVAFLTAEEAVLSCPGPDGRSDVLRIGFANARTSPRVLGEGALPGRSHYLKGNDRARWVTGVPHCESVVYRDLWPGIDLRWRFAADARLAYDLVVAPGADASVAALRIDGAESLELDACGNLVATTARGTLRQSRPVAFQEVAGRRRRVPAGFRIGNGGTAAFSLGAYDRSLPLVIDPSIEYSSYLGGGGPDHAMGNCVAVVDDGSWYVAGETGSNDFPTKGQFQTNQSTTDLFISRFAADGATLVFSTYLGGSGFDNFRGLAADGAGSAVVTGLTSSTDFPSAAAWKTTNTGGGSDAFVTKLATNGASLRWSTYVGGSAEDEGWAVAAGADGEVFLAGLTLSTNFPTVAPYQNASAGAADLFLAKFPDAGGAPEYCTYFGGSGEDHPRSVAVDGEGRALVVGYTESSNFPLQGALQATKGAGFDGFVTRFDADGAGLSFSTFLGGSGTDEVMDVTVGPGGKPFVAGYTDSPNFPVVAAFQSQIAGGGVANDAFVCRLKADGSGLEYATYFGGAEDDTAWTLAVNVLGEAVIGGATTSTALPLVDPLQASLAGGYDGFVARFSSSGSNLGFATYFGGGKDETVFGLAMSGPRVVIGGHTFSTNLPVLGAFQGTLKGTNQDDAFTARLDVGQSIPPTPTGLLVQLTALTAIVVRWNDASVNETGFRVERSVGGGAFGTVAILAPDTTSLAEAGLAPVTNYAYRVFAFNEFGESAPSNEHSVSTPPTPVSAPAAPTGLTPTIATPRRVELSWSHDSDDEDFFVLARSTDGAFFNTLATPNLGATAASDATVLPGRSYTYKLRAVNPIGASFDSNIVSVTMPETLEVLVTKGSVKDGSAFAKDSVKVQGTLSYGPDALAAAFDPATQGITMRLGDWDAPSLLLVQPGDTTWKLKKGKYTWKTPKGSLTKAKVVVDTVAGTWSVSLTRMNLASTPTNPIRVTLGAGTDSGFEEKDWTPKKSPGQLKFP